MLFNSKKKIGLVLFFANSDSFQTTDSDDPIKIGLLQSNRESTKYKHY